jgi:hypothetical protein
MNLKTKIAALLGALALLVAPTAALAGPPEYKPEKPPKTEHTKPTPGPNGTMPEKAKAYGVLCRRDSKEHVKGEKGTPFSRCVNAMAKAATTKKSAKAACKGLSKKKHVKHEKGTDFSRCVVAAAKLKKELATS